MRTVSETTPDGPADAFRRAWDRRPSHAADAADQDRLVLRIPDPASGAHLEVADPVTGAVSRVSLHHLETLAAYAQTARERGIVELNRLRAAPGITAASNAGRTVLKAAAVRKDMPLASFRIQAAPTAAADGTPYLRWVPAPTPSPADVPVWQLVLAGADTAVLGEAAWDDTAGIDTLLGQLDDPEALHALLSLVDQAAGSAMTQRLLVRALRTAGDLPTMNPAAVWTLLNDAGLHSTTSRAWERGGVKALSISTGNSRTTIAVAAWMPMWRSYDRFARTDIAAAAAAAEWEASADAAVTADGTWRVLDLTLPGANRGVRTALRFYTRIPEDQWAAVDAAARQRLATFALDGGRAL